MVTFELTQLLGLYFLIVGLIVVVRRTAFMPALKQLMLNRPMVMLLGFLELLAGLAVILAYPNGVSSSPDGIIALIGWMLAIEGVVYLLMPTKEMQKFVKRFATPTWYLAGSLAAILIGAYLTGVGFGFLHV
ncbi:MAG: hypothetical protein HYT30_01870 [Parcubacteria group bacterium]|nr:hypothetical protein [Parcubacteria group bacterium]